LLFEFFCRKGNTFFSNSNHKFRIKSKKKVRLSKYDVNVLKLIRTFANVNLKQLIKN